MATEASIKIVHIITGLDTGGAEMMMYKLLSLHDLARFDVQVISLLPAGVLGEKIRDLGIPVHSMQMISGLPSPTTIWQLARLLRREKADVVQTWMYHADLVGGLAARLAGIRAVLWNIRASTLRAEVIRRRTVWIAKLCGRLSHYLPAQILCCSEAGVAFHRELGYAEQKMLVIPNGFDLSQYQPDTQAREAVRHELDIPLSAPLIGLIARFHPMKEHQIFVRAAEIVCRSHPDTHFLLCGSEVTWDNMELAGWIDSAGLRSQFRLLGRRGDVPRLNAALDIATSSSSSGEGFSNTIGEAMATGVVCVVTDVGDSALIVGDTGRIVPSCNPDALATAWGEILSLEEDARLQLGQRARERVEQNFKLQTIVCRYEEIYKRLFHER